MNPNLVGDLLIVLALSFNILAGLFYLMVARGNRDYEALAQRCYNWFVIFSTLMLSYLFALFFMHDFRVKYVYDYSDSNLPFFYELSALWAGQEGTYVLWLFMSALFGYAIMKRAGQYRYYGMFVFSLVNLFFLSIMLKLSPYALTPFAAAEGAGLNPLLQDPWMVIHPPVMFVGYAVAAVPFAIAMAALIRNDYSAWVRRAFPWVGVAAFMLAAGNILGGYWAYKTLGWGGFWAWDPVENSSFIPWFLSLALLHGMVIERRTGALRRTNLLMSALLFVSVIYGTFLTRSGVLADFSVHSFVDLGINIFLVVFLIFYTLFALVLFLVRARSIDSQPLTYNFYSKEFSLFAGMTLLFLFSMVVLVWTSLPLLTTLSGEPRAANLATYNGFGLPFAIIYAVFLSAAPFLNYNKFASQSWKGIISIAALVTAIFGFGLFYFLLNASLVFAVVLIMFVCGITAYMLKSDLRAYLRWGIFGFIIAVVIGLAAGSHNYLYLLYFGAAAMFVVTNLISFFSYLPHRLKMSGGQLTHFGFGLMLIGILGSSGYSTGKKLVIDRGKYEQAFDLNISYQGMVNDIDTPKNQLILTYNDGGDDVAVHPELYYSQRLDGIMRKPYVKKDLLEDIYLSPEQIQDLDSEGGLTLIKGEPHEAMGYTFTFDSFEMGSHDSSVGGMTVLANIQVEYDDTTTAIAPAKSTPGGEESGRRFIDHPATFGSNHEFSASIDKILADQNAVVIKVPGLLEEGPPDRLILDVSIKPIINLVWTGTTIILLGGILVFLRRFGETATA